MKRILLFFTLIISANIAIAQTDAHHSSQEKKATQKKEKQEKAALKAEEKGIKKHRSIQSKEVRKRMKRNDKRYQHLDSSDRRPNFFRRLFPRKKPSAY
jgi:hypothetical protein